MWIFRGQEILAIMQEECFDLPLYEWTKVDTSDAVRSCFWHCKKSGFIFARRPYLEEGFHSPSIFPLLCCISRQILKGQHKERADYSFYCTVHA